MKNPQPKGRGSIKGYRREALVGKNCNLVEVSTGNIQR
jgi:hypothetical protein